MHSSLAENILQSAANPKDTCCQWCKHPQKRIRTAGLCNHCYRLKLELKHCESNLANFTLDSRDPKASRSQRHFLEHQLKVAGRMMELAKGEGESYAQFAHTVTGLELERELRFVSERWLRDDLFIGWANILDWSFDQTQKRLLFFMLKRMTMEYLREKRRNIAERNVFDDEREQGSA
jgi:hypothetical protein